MENGKLFLSDFEMDVKMDVSKGDGIIKEIDDESMKNEMLLHVNTNNDMNQLLVGLTSDGASVFTGKETGVNVRLRETYNGHCVSHRC